jgi:hypothetical protein
MTTSTLSELAALNLDRPPVDATESVCAAWHERRATVLDHLAAEGSAVARTAAESAHHYASLLASNVICGGMPRQGKTNAMRALLLGADLLTGGTR